MFPKATLFALTFAAAVFGQGVGTNTAEVHPSLPWQKCTKSGGCSTVSSGAVTLDANWRWVHTNTGYTNCYTGNKWDATLCPDGKTCAANCALDGADYPGTYGVTTSGNALTLKFVTSGANKNVGSRLYMMASDSQYQLFKPLNQEFSFDVDVSNLPCGLNGAVYFSEMPADGGSGQYPTNKAGAKYGTGYCDSQCPRDIKFINGVANSAGWNSTAANTGNGNMGACCNEFDLWEANSVSAALTPHPCAATGISVCTGSTCQTGSGSRYSSVCDPDGCDFNSFRMGDKSFYGPGKTVDTTKKFTIVTQFITNDGTATGTLSEIRRLYVQNGVVIQNSKVNVPGMTAYNSITSQYCTDQKKAFGDTDSFGSKGGLAQMSKALARGMVLVLSIWDDYAVNMLWLDGSAFPTTSNPATPGIARGTCSTSSGAPADVEANSPNASVTYSNIKVGDIGSTYGGSTGGGGSSTKTTTTKGGSTTTTTSAPGPTQTKYGQCGGQGWNGPTVCAAGSTCTVSNPYYSQCL